MSDLITATGSESKYKPHPEGQFVGQCVDVIDLGEKVSDFPGETPYLVRQCALVFRTGELNEETNEFVDVHRDFTVSMGDKANLRKFLEQWRGKPYTPEQVKAGVPLDKLTGNHGLLTVAHRPTAKRVYANVTACVGIPKQMAASVEDFSTTYTRAEFWTAWKKVNVEAVAAFKAKNAPPERDDIPSAPNDDSDLPF